MATKSTGRAGGGFLVTGVAAVDAKLKGLPLAAQKKLSRKATRQSAKDIVLPAAKDNAPVDSGDLEESLTVRALKRSRTKFGHMVTTGEGFWKGEQFYGAFLEFGTKERFHKTSQKSVGRIVSQVHAFLRRALYDNADRIRGTYVNAMGELLREVSVQ